MRNWSGELRKCCETSAAQLCQSPPPRMHPDAVDWSDLATQIKFDCRRFWPRARSSSPHMVVEPRQSLNGDSQSIQTDYMIGSPGHQNFINQSRLHLPGSCASPTVSAASQERRREEENMRHKRVCVCVWVVIVYAGGCILGDAGDVTFHIQKHKSDELSNDTGLSVDSGSQEDTVCLSQVITSTLCTILSFK